LSEIDPERRHLHLERALWILKPLAAANRLDTARRRWIAGIETKLAALGTCPKSSAENGRGASSFSGLVSAMEQEKSAPARDWFLARQPGHKE
jgi:hypothetical protein